MSNKVADFFNRVSNIVDKYYKGNVSEFCSENDITTSYYYKWQKQSKGEIEGSPNPSMKVLLNIVDNTGVSPTWLLTGIGDPLLDQMTSDVARKVSGHEALLNDLKNSDISSDEKLEVVAGQLESLVKIIRNQ